MLCLLNSVCLMICLSIDGFVVCCFVTFCHLCLNDEDICVHACNNILSNKYFCFSNETQYFLFTKFISALVIIHLSIYISYKNCRFIKHQAEFSDFPAYTTFCFLLLKISYHKYLVLKRKILCCFCLFVSRSSRSFQYSNK